MTLPLTARSLGRQDYLPVWEAMQAFTARRDAETVDELWLLEHPAVYTIGLNGKPEHLRTPGVIPVVRVDRGGQVTYHGPGQLVAYPLLDLRRLRLGPRLIVSALEQAVIQVLAGYGIRGTNRSTAPGVYVDGAKIAAIGLRIRRGCCYHGLSLNIAMELEPYAGINPCGYPDLQVTQLSEFVGQVDRKEVERRLIISIGHQLNLSLNPHHAESDDVFLGASTVVSR